MAEWSTEFCWGALWTRPGLTAAPAASSIRDARRAQSALRTEAARQRSPEERLTKDEIKEILLQVGSGCGIPSGIDAFRNAREAFNEVAK